MIRFSYTIILLSSFLLSQNKEIIEITKHIGYTLDAEENKYYKVFEDIPNFENAQFFMSTNDTVEARISYLEFTRTKTSKKIFALRSFVDLQFQLNKMPPIT